MSPYSLVQGNQWSLDRTDDQDPAPLVQIYVLSWERFETLALCLAGLCGYNLGVGPIHVLDDGSKDPRVHKLLDRYRSAGLVDTVEVSPSNRGIGLQRRRVFDHFLETGAEYVVQVENDILLPPAGIAQLVTAYRQIQDSGAGISWLAPHQVEWCHTTILERTIGRYRISLSRSGSEPIWCTDRKMVSENLPLLPGGRPDLVLFLRAVTATILRDPEIQCQHLGAINSHYYPQWTPEMVTYYNQDGSARQPFPWFSLDFNLDRRRYLALYLHYSELLRTHAPVEIPSALEV